VVSENEMLYERLKENSFSDAPAKNNSTVKVNNNI
jgi:hypothetical protein